MTKTQVYFRDEELRALHSTAQQTGRSVADLVREAVRKVWVRDQAGGPIALWDGEVTCSAVDHDSIYDDP